jgi:16S rRNA (cytidine1402-2'-O)-methyltransferase
MGTLYLVSTPIGNLEDITARALRILGEVSVIAAEDTRVTKNLLRHFNIHTPLIRWDAHTERRDTATVDLIARLQVGESIALVSDAGTPCLSDPGADLVAAAAQAGILVVPIPGANALLPALIASGLPTGRFVFEGFLPRSGSDHKERLEVLSGESRTVVLYEAPHRIVETLEDLEKYCGPTRRIVAGREITKKFEEFVRGTIAEVLAHFRANDPRGEFVLVLEGGEAIAQVTLSPETLLREAMARGLSAKDSAREVSHKTNISRNTLYAQALALKEEIPT